MRISDWSSDVCSSDLAHALGLAGRLDAVDHPHGTAGAEGPVLVGLAMEAERLDAVRQSDVEDVGVGSVVDLGPAGASGAAALGRPRAHVGHPSAGADPADEDRKSVV